MHIRLLLPVFICLYVLQKQDSQIHGPRIRFCSRGVEAAQGHGPPLKKLSVNNLDNLTPHPLHVFLHYSHPPVLERVRRLEKAT